MTDNPPAALPPATVPTTPPATQPTRMRRGWMLAAQLAVGAIAIALTWRRLRADWGQVSWSSVSIDTGALVTACLVSAVFVFLAYGVLIENWRRVLQEWGGELSRVNAAHIWFVSNLGRLLPGRVWQIGAMAGLAERAGVSGVAASGAAIVLNLVNLVAGAAVVVAASTVGVNVLGASSQMLGSAGIDGRGAWLAAGVLTLALGLSPVVIPRAARLAARLLGRTDPGIRVPGMSIALAFVGCTVGWVLYGLGFWALAGALGSSVTMTPLTAVAVYTASYLFGYLMLFAPAGLVFREAMLFSTMTQLHLAGASEAAVLAVLSRLWLTVIEVVPGLLFLFRRPPAASPPV